MQNEKAVQIYEQEKQHFLSTVESCWDTDCGGTIHQNENPEKYVDDEKEELLRLATCEKCGKSWSFWTFRQWMKNKRIGARTSLHNVKGHRESARMEYNRAVNDAKKLLALRMRLIQDEVDTARETLSMLRGEGAQ